MKESLLRRMNLKNESELGDIYVGIIYLQINKLLQATLENYI